MPAFKFHHLKEFRKYTTILYDYQTSTNLAWSAILYSSENIQMYTSRCLQLYRIWIQFLW